MGTARGEIAIVGDFDEAAISAELQALFPDYVSRSPYARVDREYPPVAPQRIVIDTPDKENAFLRARSRHLKLRDDDDRRRRPVRGQQYFWRQQRTVEPADGSLAAEGRPQLQRRFEPCRWVAARSIDLVLCRDGRAAEPGRAEQAFLEETRARARDGFTPQKRSPRPRRASSKRAPSLARRTARRRALDLPARPRSRLAVLQGLRDARSWR
jgi:hypothetical protein